MGVLLWVDDNIQQGLGHHQGSLTWNPSSWTLLFEELQPTLLIWCVKWQDGGSEILLLISFLFGQIAANVAWKKKHGFKSMADVSWGTHVFHIFLKQSTGVYQWRELVWIDLPTGFNRQGQPRPVATVAKTTLTVFFGGRFSWISTVFLEVVVENVDLHVYPCFVDTLKCWKTIIYSSKWGSIQTSNSASLKLKEVQVSPCRAPWVRCHGGNSLAMYIMYHNVCWWCCQSMCLEMSRKR